VVSGRHPPRLARSTGRGPRPWRMPWRSNCRRGDRRDDNPANPVPLSAPPAL
jgi:hypothetical protein